MVAECLFEALKPPDHFEMKLDCWLQIAKAWEVSPKAQLQSLPSDGSGGLDKEQFIQFMILTCVKTNCNAASLKKCVTKSFMIVGERSP